MAIFVLSDLLFTVVSIVVSPASSQTGTARPLGTIPAHEAELALAGLALGVLALGIYGKAGVPVALLLPAMTILLDLDHLPAFLGVAQPIRPAHSLIFLAVVVVATSVALRRLDFGVVALSAFAGHMAIDTGVIPAFSPLSFQDFSLAPYRLTSLVTAVLLAFIAGYLMRRSLPRPPGAEHLLRGSKGGS